MKKLGPEMSHSNGSKNDVSFDSFDNCEIDDDNCGGSLGQRCLTAMAAKTT